MVATDQAKEYARIAASAAAELKAVSISAIDVSDRLMLTDVFLVVSGSSDRQVRALVDAIDEAMLKAGVHRQRREGMDASPHWVIIDFDELMVHVQQEEDRELYALEKLWGDCPVIDLGIDTGEETSTLDRLLAGSSEEASDRPEDPEA